MIRLPGFGLGRGTKPEDEAEAERPSGPAAEPPAPAPDEDAVAPDELLAEYAARADAEPADGVVDDETAPADAKRGGLDVPSVDEQMRMVEAMLFASNAPLSTADLAERMPVGCDAAHAVRQLESVYARRGVHLVRVAGKWAFRTAPDLAFLMRGEVVEQRKLSKAAIETLAVISYHQPVTRAEIEEIRQVGVSKGTIDLLMELDWVKLGRRRQTPGRPVTFVTTDHFLQKFGLDSLRDLPGLDELRQAGLLDRRPPSGGAPLGAGEAGDEAEADEAAEELSAEEAAAEKRRQEEMTM